MFTLVKNISEAISNKLNDPLISSFYVEATAVSSDPASPTKAQLWLILSDGTELLTLRETVRPIWHAHNPPPNLALFVSTVSDLANMIQFSPVWANETFTKAQPIMGAPTYIDRLTLETAVSQQAYFAHRLMEASAAIMPDRLSLESKKSSLAKLAALSNSGSSSKSAFAQLQQTLSAQLASDEVWVVDPNIQDENLPGLLSIYMIGNDEIILVFDHLSPERIAATDWKTINKEIDPDIKKIYLVTAVQLQFIMRAAVPLDMMLQKYTHKWGQDLLTAVSLDHKKTIMQAAEFPARVLIHTLPTGYLTLPDDQIGMLIHDIQNKLLNIQLRHELLFRMLEKTRFVPKTPILGRDASRIMRMTNIKKYLREWVDFYKEEIEKSGD